MIPSLSGDVSGAAASLERQTMTDWELIVVTGERPAARARNIGVTRARGELILFLDDDARLGHPRVLEQLVETASDSRIGVVGTSKILPADASAFQRRVAAEVPRWVFPVVTEQLVSNPPIDAYGFTAATTTGCLIPRHVLEEVGGFDERLPTGEDTELFYRIRRAGYEFVIAARSWTDHSPPATLRVLLTKSFRYGVGAALESKLAPDRNMALVPFDRPLGLATLIVAPLLFLPSIFVAPYFEPNRRLRFGFRPLKAMASIATFYGMAWGHYAHRG